jgi:hypothetical protein
MHSLGSLLLALCLVSACSFRKQVETMPTHLAGKRVQIRSTDGRTRAVRAEATPTGLAWRDVQGRLVRSSDVVEVSWVSHGRGAIDGLLVGLSGGIATGMVAGLVVSDSAVANIMETDCVRCLTTGDKVIVLGAFGGVIGAVAGLVVGAGGGTRFTYKLRAEDKPRVHLVGPSGSVAGLSWIF